jgi:hypothetical protein
VRHAVPIRRLLLKQVNGRRRKCSGYSPSISHFNIHKLIHEAVRL